MSNYDYFCGMKTLYVTDMDGTLLGPDSKVSPTSAKIICDLTSQGALITVATARTPATVQPILAHTAMALPAIVMTGASLWDREKCSYINPSHIDNVTARCIEEKSATYGVALFQYTLSQDNVLDVYHQGKMSPKEQNFVNERSDLRYKRFHLDSLYNHHQPTLLYFAMGELQRIFSLAEELRATVECSVSAYVDIFGADTGILEIFAPQVSKAAAVKSLANTINADRIVVFGDNLNDIPMMQVADVSVAVGNALDQVKAMATHVIEANITDSVARFIAHDVENTH